MMATGNSKNSNQGPSGRSSAKAVEAARASRRASPQPKAPQGPPSPGKSLGGGASHGVATSSIAKRATSRVTAQTNDNGDRLAKKGAPQSKVDQARAQDAKLNNRRIPIGNKANTSKSKKAGSVIKGAVDGAAGRNTAGKLAVGQLSGAIAGAAQALLSVTKRRTMVFLVLANLLPVMLLIAAPFVIASVVIGAMAGQNTAAATQASVTTSGLSQQATVTIQQASDGTATPWELMAATVYYETGPGSAVSQNKTSCPKGTPPGGICPAVPARTTTPGGHFPPATLAHSGLTPKVGRNGSVPAHLLPTSPDFVTTNTADWDCIRDAESGDVYGITSGAYGFIGTKAHPYTLGVYNVPGVTGPASTATPAEQNKVALAILNREGHFYGAWNDVCTGSGGTTENALSMIAPGVEIPATPGSATSYGATPLSVATTQASLPAGGTGTPTTTTTAPQPTTPTTAPRSVTTTPAMQTQKCPAQSSGPYCLTTASPHTPTSPAALTAQEKVNLKTSTRWVAEQLQTALRGKGVYGSLDLSAGVTVPTGGVPYVNTSAATAIEDRTFVIDSLATLPVAGNSTALDTNIYEMAVAWASGYSPPPSTAPCIVSTTPPAPAPTAIAGPSLGTSPTDVGLTKTQVTVAFKIVSAAQADSASTGAKVALVAAGLAASQLGKTVDSLGTKTGIFGTGSTTVTAAVKSLAAKMAGKSAPPATLAAQAVGHGNSAIFYTGWIAGATQLVNMATGTRDACGGGATNTQAGVAIKAAEGEVGLPYVYGGGSDTGPTLGLSGKGATACANGKVVSTNGTNGNPCTQEYASQTGNPGFDCSGLTMFAWHIAGVTLQHNATLQYQYVKQHSTLDSDVNTLAPGDLMFYKFPGTGTTQADHVAMYLGSGEEIQAPEGGTDVEVVPVYKTHFIGGGLP
jgi:cell wall-associated NlpC family hydrolase